MLWDYERRPGQSPLPAGARHRSTAATAAATDGGGGGASDAAVLVLGSGEFDERAGANNNVIAFAVATSKERCHLPLYAARK